MFSCIFCVDLNVVFLKGRICHEFQAFILPIVAQDYKQDDWI